MLVERIDKVIKKKEWPAAYDAINSFERQLVDDGHVIVKFLLHIDKSEQKKRFKKLRKNPATRWKVTREDWRHHKQYNLYVKAYDDLLRKTGNAVCALDRRRSPRRTLCRGQGLSRNHQGARAAHRRRGKEKIDRHHPRAICTNG